MRALYAATVGRIGRLWGIKDPDALDLAIMFVFLPALPVAGWHLWKGPLESVALWAVFMMATLVASYFVKEDGA